MNAAMTSVFGARATAIAIFFQLLAGCSATLPAGDPRTPVGVFKSISVRSGLTAVEQNSYDRKSSELDTKTYYHEIVLNSTALIDKLEGHQRFPTLEVVAPIYLLGIEKPQKRHVIPEHSCKTGDFVFADLERASPEGRKAACDTLDDPHMEVLTHIVRFDGVASGVYQRPCFLYNVYYSESSCDAASSNSAAAISDLYKDGVKAVDSLHAELERHLEGITHIIVLSTGWNTHQDESLYDYLEWMSVVQSQMPVGGHFHPLYLGFSWQSKWDFSIPKFGAINKISVANKGNDADEVGLRWANRLIHSVVIPLASTRDIPIILIGHSYGTRILGTPVYRRDSTRNPAALVTAPLAFLALEPAFTLNRFAKGKEATFATETPPTTLVVMTSSQHDEAGVLTRLVDVPYALSDSGFRQVSANKFPLIAPDKVSLNGHVVGYPLHRPGLYLLDASSIVDDHNDVYDREVGTLFWDVVNSAQNR